MGETVSHLPPVIFWEGWVKPTVPSSFGCSPEPPPSASVAGRNPIGSIGLVYLYTISYRQLPKKNRRSVDNYCTSNDM